MQSVVSSEPSFPLFSSADQSDLLSFFTLPSDAPIFGDTGVQELFLDIPCPEMPEGQFVEEILDYFVDPRDPTSIVLSSQFGCQPLSLSANRPCEMPKSGDTASSYDVAKACNTAKNPYDMVKTCDAVKNPYDMVKTCDAAKKLYDMVNAPSCDEESLRPLQSPRLAKGPQRDEDRAKVRRERNRLAAERCRARKTTLISSLQAECDRLKSERDKLLSENEVLLDLLLKSGFLVGPRTAISS